MSANHVERHGELRRGFRQLSRVQSEVMAGFTSMHRAAVADGELPGATKEMMALAISIVTHCEGCIAFHVHDALRAGASRGQIEETIGVAIMMGGGPAAVYGATAAEALDQFVAAGVGSDAV
ncbi:MAG: carboxymuconolactone decarboxylase family protein [Acidimicrobiales bacterium]